jgi:PAS domain S-box-containing protein
MKTMPDSKSALLRRKAEAFLKNRMDSNAQPLSEADTLRLVHELQVHQVELEMQYEELEIAKNQLAEAASNKYAELYDFAPSAYLTLSKAGEILELNFRASQMLGKERTDLRNSSLDFFVSDDSKPVFNLFLEKVFKSYTNETCDLTLSDKANQIQFVQLSGIAIENHKQCLVAMVDITERKKAELLIRRQNQELIKINDEKDKFFSIIAHDLRGPIGNFMGLTERMAEGMKDMTIDQLQEIATVMKKSSSNLYSLLGNLLEWSRMQRGLITFEPFSFLLKPKIFEIIKYATDVAANKEIVVSSCIPDKLEVFADENMLASIIRNLVDNAVKFTPKGGNISISACTIPGNKIEISITDSGIGMNKDIVENLFNHNINTSRKGTEGELSTGLGLMICKDFIEMHGGVITIESKAGEGSTFRFTIPVTDSL